MACYSPLRKVMQALLKQYLVLRARFKPGTLRVQVNNITAWTNVTNGVVGDIPLGDILNYILLLFLFGGERFCVLRACLGLKIKLYNPVLIPQL
jgi:hypothetical protein